MKTDDVLDMIDRAVGDTQVSRDAMRWGPGVEEPTDAEPINLTVMINGEWVPLAFLNLVTTEQGRTYVTIPANPPLYLDANRSPLGRELARVRR